jgi:hypothetical protein
MGLDTFAARTPHPFGLEDDDVAALGEVEVDANPVPELDRDWIPHAEVRSLADALAGARDLGPFLRTCADRGLNLVGYHHEDPPRFVVVAARVPHPHGLTDEDVTALDTAAPDLCGGMYSGEEGSFRGKVYAELIEQITGTSIYAQWLPPETVREMAAAFGPGDHPSIEHSAEEVGQLAAFFRVCADRGLGLVGWW